MGSNVFATNDKLKLITLKDKILKNKKKLDHKWEEYIVKRATKQVKTKGTLNSIINKVIPHHSIQLNIMPPSLVKSKTISCYPNCPKDNALEHGPQRS